MKMKSQAESAPRLGLFVVKNGVPRSRLVGSPVPEADSSLKAREHNLTHVAGQRGHLGRSALLRRPSCARVGQTQFARHSAVRRTRRLSALTVAALSSPSTARAVTRTMRTGGSASPYRPPTFVAGAPGEYANGYAHRAAIDPAGISCLACRISQADKRPTRVAPTGRCHRRSMIVPVASAPPQHIEIRASDSSRRSNSCSAVVIRRLPVAPTGCPRAIAPPLTFTLSRSAS